jgi:N-hydroxyarylamine O-acetyltransferase
MSVDAMTGISEHMPTVDLDAYFRRIAYAGKREPSLDVLQTIVLQHTQTIPFENLNPWLRWPVYLDRASLLHKLVHSGRGGYCYEQNGLFNHVAQALGFIVTPLAARVVWNRPADAPAPRSHMLLCITINAQPYLVDVGFGGMTPTGVLRLETDGAQATPHEPFRLLQMGKGFLMQAEVRGEWLPLYRFDLQEQEPADYDVANWYTSHHPQSTFVTGLSMARPAPDCRYALRNTELTIHHRNGQTEKHTLTSVDALRTTFEETFRVTLPDAPAVDLALHQLIKQAGV